MRNGVWAVTLLALASLAFGGAVSYSAAVQVFVQPRRGMPAAKPPIDTIRNSCGTFNPFFVTTNFAYSGAGRTWADDPAIVAFRDSEGDELPPHIVLADHGQVGAVYGLAYDAERGRLYAAAYHKRSTVLWPAGPGQVYEIDLATERVRPLVDLPAGPDRHGHADADDEPAARWVGKTGLADIEIDGDGSTLFVVNLHDRRIYRIGLPDGTVLGSFDHGTAGSDWAGWARPFGLGYRDGWLYHGVVRSVDIQGPQGYVYRSRADGSEMTELVRFELDYPRGMRWNNWDDRVRGPVGQRFYQQGIAQPMISDIEFTLGGEPILGIRDRMSDMLPVLFRDGWHPGVGDVLPGHRTDDGWSVITGSEHYVDQITVDESAWGGLAAFPGFDFVVSSALWPTHFWEGATSLGAFWLWNGSGGIARREPIQPDYAVGPAGILANGLGDVEPLCPRSVDTRPDVPPTATSFAATATSASATETATAQVTQPPVRGATPVAPPEGFDEVVRASCLRNNPYAATVCYQLENYVAVVWPFIWDAPAIVAFRDTPDSDPVYMLASLRQVGTSMGLAYSGSERALYAAAYHKRMAFFGHGGPGAIDRVDLTSGDVALFTQVPDAGPDLHDPDPEHLDQSGRDWAGKLSLGDVDLSTDERTLFVVNLNDRRLYRYDVSSGSLLGSFRPGSAAEDWAEDARPLALAYHRGRLYHGVVNSAETTRRREDIEANIYESRPDGSDMRLVARFPLDYERGTMQIPGVVGQPSHEVSIDWQHWQSGENDFSDRRAQLSVFPQPMLADIEFAPDGAMIVSVRDRHADMSAGSQMFLGGAYLKPGLSAGDVLRLPFNGTDWLGPPDHGFLGRTAGSDTVESIIGGSAWLTGVDQLLTGRQWLLPGVSDPFYGVGHVPGVVWHDARGNPLRLESPCHLRAFQNPIVPHTLRAMPASPLHNEWLPSGGMGDIEVLCGPPVPTPSPSPSPTPSTTATASATITPTRTPAPAYLPILLYQCDPQFQHVDVVLVIDASTSMLEDTRAGRPKRDAAREAALLFLERMKLPGDQLAVVAFNADAAVLQELTGDREALEDALRGTENRELTRIHLGIRAAHRLLTGTGHIVDNTPAMIVLTDGRSNPDPVQLAIDAANAAKSDGITIFTVGLGETIERDALERIATRSDYYRHAPDGEDLGPVYERIAYEIPCPPAPDWPLRP